MRGKELPRPAIPQSRGGADQREAIQDSDRARGDDRRAHRLRRGTRLQERWPAQHGSAQGGAGVVRRKKNSAQILLGLSALEISGADVGRCDRAGRKL